MEWTSSGACRSAEPELFFPVGGTPVGSFGSAMSVAAREAEAAKAICRRCPVIAECRDYALATKQQYGVWGGLDEVERRSVLLATA